MEMTVIESDTINRDSTVQLLSMLDRKYDDTKQIIVNLDNARYLLSKEVHDVVQGSPRLKLVCLPAYSPELTLIERVWKYFKNQVLYNKYCENGGEFRKVAIDFSKILIAISPHLENCLMGPSKIFLPKFQTLLVYLYNY